MSRTVSEEPAGARMQVVKGFSTFLYDGLAPALPKQREHFVASFPKWTGRNWVASLGLEGATLQTMVLFVYPSGRYRLQLFNAQGFGQETVGQVNRNQMDNEDEPIRFCYERIVRRHRQLLTRFLTEVSRC